jgi:hypothetical protein
MGKKLDVYDASVMADAQARRKLKKLGGKSEAVVRKSDNPKTERRRDFYRFN